MEQKPKRDRVLEMRMQGYTLQEIADAEGYATPAGPWGIINRHMTADPTADLANEYRRKLLESLEKDLELLATLETKAANETDEAKQLDMHLKVIKMKAELGDRQAKLTGANAPEKVEQSVSMTFEETLKELE